jgi:pimeloyl-ACP methyl ester carboxylesterase
MQHPLFKASGVARAVLSLAVLVAAQGPVAGKKIDAGDCRLKMMRKGRGQPTVVFDSGLGDSHEVWRWVWPEVARFTGVLLYDRAGLGRSDTGPEPRTSAQMVRELRTLLRNAKVEPPYVLVGHSLGGMNLRLFAIRYPDEVAGLVLVDATPLDFPEWFLRQPASRARMETMASVAGADREQHEIPGASLARDPGPSAPRAGREGSSAPWRSWNRLCSGCPLSALGHPAARVSRP